MKVKTSLSLSTDTLRALDAARNAHTSRSELVERAIHEFLARKARFDRDRQERERIDANASALNVEMADILSFQAGE